MTWWVEDVRCTAWGGQRELRGYSGGSRDTEAWVYSSV